MSVKEVNCLVIGTGLAGCSTAYALAEAGIDVTLVTRSSQPEDNATSRAQGGIVFKGEQESSSQTLIQDIEKAGAGLCYRPAVELIASEGPKLVQSVLLDRLQIDFDQKDDGSIHLTGEAVHSMPRIIHYGDQTGIQIEKAFLRFLKNHKKVTFLTEHTAIDLLTLSHHSTKPQDMYEAPRCVGAYVLNQKKKKVVTFLAKETVLATGGLGQLYLHTTNPSGARGDGLAMAYRTGARIMNLEYLQFHPTALYRKHSKRFLITEAIRGEGGKLINDTGEEFMQNYDPKGALAARDIVARAIHDEMIKRSSPCVYLDISFKDADWVRNRFPSIYKECMEQGVDISKEPIPVVPAAHYSCGGVAVDLDGNTTIANLKAVGEVSCTGVHGANRLASTSLLEDLVWGVRAGKDIAKKIEKATYAFPQVRPWRSEKLYVDMELLYQDWQTIKYTMWNYVGLVRTPKRLERAQRILRELMAEVDKFYAGSELSDELIGLRNGATSAQLILTAARRNPQSKGCHYVRED